MHPRPTDSIPQATDRIARQAFPKGNRYILLRDELGTIYTDVDVKGSLPEQLPLLSAQN